MLPFLPNFSGAFARMEPVNIPAKFEVHSFTCSRDNRGVLEKIEKALDMPTLLFLPNFSGAITRIDPVNIPAKFEVRSSTNS